MRIRVPIPTVLVVAAILTVVLLPGSSVPDTPDIPGFDKMIHGIMFLALAVALHLDFALDNARRLLVSVAAAFAFAALTEILQLAVDGRSAELFDLVADTAGLLVGLATRRPLAAVVRKACSAAGKLFRRGG